MIVVSVGTQLPFDRLIQAIDEIAPHLNRKVFAQIGQSKYLPRNIEWSKDFSATEFDSILREASILVAHAGIGTVLKAYQFGKPIILMPRQASFGEHRNDHQLATASKLSGRPGIHVANDQAELKSMLTRLETFEAPSQLDPPGRVRLQSYLASIADQILAGKAR